MSLPSGQRSAPISISSAVDPLGSPPDLYNPPSLAGAVFAVGTTLLIVSALSVVLRLITNYRVVGKLKMADCASRLYSRKSQVHLWLKVVIRSLPFCVHFNDVLLRCDICS